MALDILLIGLTLIFLLVVATLQPFARFAGGDLPLVYLVALLVTLIPTTIGGLLSAIGIAGMDRLVRLNVIAKSGRAVEAAGDVHVLLLDKTGTITFGNRRCSALVKAPGVSGKELSDAALLASLADDTPEGKSIVDYLRALSAMVEPARDEVTAIAFSAETRLSGVDWNGHSYRKGAVDAVLAWVGMSRAEMPEQLSREIDRIAQSGGTRCWWPPMAGCWAASTSGRGQARHPRALRRAAADGHPHRDGHRRQPADRCRHRRRGGVDDMIAEATPEKKLARIRQEQGEGKMVAMCGDGANDARRWPRPTSAWR